MDLSDKTALVTGASGAIGRATAIALAETGAQIILTGTRVDALRETAAAAGPGVEIVSADLGSESGPKDLVDAVNAQFGGVDILVNNAGVARDGLTMRLSDADWAGVLDVNLTAAFKLIRAVLRDMMKKRWGRIIGVSSVVGAAGNIGQANYAAAKAGMIGMTKSIAREVAGRGITANCVAPGFITSDMTASLSESQSQAVLATIPASRFGTPEDVAASIVFLASRESSYITGQTLHVNGGMVMM